MTAWTKQEIQAELKRRSSEEAERDRQFQAASQKRLDREADAHCIHCGQPFVSWQATAGEFGLCDDCNYRD